MTIYGNDVGRSSPYVSIWYGTGPGVFGNTSKGTLVASPFFYNVNASFDNGFPIQLSNSRYYIFEYSNANSGNNAVVPYMIQFKRIVW